MEYLYTEARQFSRNIDVGKCKAVLLTNDGTVGAVSATADLCIYNDRGLTAYHRTYLSASDGTKIFECRLWGISYGAGITGAVLA